MCRVYRGLVQLVLGFFRGKHLNLIVTIFLVSFELKKLRIKPNGEIPVYPGITTPLFTIEDKNTLFTFPPSCSSVTMAMTTTSCSQTICQKSCVVLGSGPYNKSNVIIVCYQCDQLAGFLNPVPDFFLWVL